MRGAMRLNFYIGFRARPNVGGSAGGDAVVVGGTSRIAEKPPLWC